ncbi:MAG TPA: branched-chain amino acid ABC transporter permease, partial [Gaiellaceae bacterium]|nr:branched-chain amino acid ABC transporter permease [Gaiellaceae bacterium]
MSELAQLVTNGLVTGSIIAIAAIGLSLVYGILKIVNFAHGDYLTLGAFFAFAVNVTWGAGMVVAVLSGIAAVALLAIVLEVGLWRPLRRRGSGLIGLFIVSIGLALVLRNVILLVWGARPRRYDVDVFQVYELGPIRLSLSQIVVIAVASTTIALVGLMLARTRLGKAMRALADSRQLAAATGIDADRITLYTWLLAGGLAGLGGVLQGLLQNAFTPNMGFTLLLPIFAAVILGGVGSAYGALVGGLLLGLIMEVSTWSG